MNRFDRRQFVGGSLAGLGLMALPRRTWAQSANNQVNLGIIGCGWRGGQLFDSFSRIEGVNIAALCDPDQARSAELGEKAPSANRYTDLRELLDQDEIDAVAVANCNHWHCLAAIWALEAGKHVYVEKPLSHTQWEGQQLVNAVARYKKLCQVGTQQRSDPMQEEIKQLLHEERTLGDIRAVQVHRFGVREPIGRREEPLEIPGTVDFDLWTGPAARQEIYRSEFHYDWHWDWNTGSGEMGNWGVHIVDDVRNNVFRDQVAFPRAVAGAGGRFVWDDAGNTPNLQLAWFDTGDIPVTIAVCNLPARAGGDRPPRVPGFGSGYAVLCEGGRLEGARGQAVALDADGKEIRRFRGDGGGSHQQNFIDAVRSDNADGLNTPVEVGHHSTAWCNLANIATRLATENPSSTTSVDELPGATRVAAADELERLQKLLADYDLAAEAENFSFGPVLQFAPDQQRFVGEQAATANEHLRRTDREPFVVPEVSAAATA